MVIPLKLLKWLLIIAGIYCLCTGETEPIAAFVMIGFGLALFLLGGGKNNSGSTSSTPNPSNPAPTPQQPEPKMQEEPPKEIVLYCPSCGEELQQDQIYCESCGTKVK